MWGYFHDALQAKPNGLCAGFAITLVGREAAEGGDEAQDLVDFGEFGDFGKSMIEKEKNCVFRTTWK